MTGCSSHTKRALTKSPRFQMVIRSPRTNWNKWKKKHIISTYREWVKLKPSSAHTGRFIHKTTYKCLSFRLSKSSYTRPVANGTGVVGMAGALVDKFGVLVGKEPVPVGKGGAAVDNSGVLVEVAVPGNGGNELVLLPPKGGLACLYWSYG